MDILNNFKWGNSCKSMYIQIANFFIDNISRGKLKREEKFLLSTNLAKHTILRLL